jgi:hypothetical protein
MKIYWIVKLLKVFFRMPKGDNPNYKPIGGGWYLGSFDWHPVRGRWVYIGFYRSFEKANTCTGAHWAAFNMKLFSIRIQTNA